MIETSVVKELIVNFVENVLPLSERETGRERDRERGRETDRDRQTDRQTDRQRAVIIFLSNINLFSRLSKNTFPQTIFILLCYA